MILAGGRNPVPGRGGPPGPSARHSLALAACSTWQPVIWQPPGSPRHGPAWQDTAPHSLSLCQLLTARMGSPSAAAPAAPGHTGLELGLELGLEVGLELELGILPPALQVPALQPLAPGDTVMNTRMTYLHGSQLIQNSRQLSRLFPGESMRSSAGMSAGTRCNQACTRD